MRKHVASWLRSLVVEWARVDGEDHPVLFDLECQRLSAAVLHRLDKREPKLTAALAHLEEYSVRCERRRRRWMDLNRMHREAQIIAELELQAQIGN